MSNFQHVSDPKCALSLRSVNASLSKSIPIGHNCNHISYLATQSNTKWRAQIFHKAGICHNNYRVIDCTVDIAGKGRVGFTALDIKKKGGRNALERRTMYPMVDSACR